MRGRIPTPTKILMARGSWRAKARADEPQAPPGRPERPTFLDREGRACWDRVTASLEALGLLSTADGEVLAGLAQNWSLFVRASRALNRTSADQLAEKRSLVATASDAYRNYVTSCREFGLTPASRTRVHGTTTAADAGTDRFWKTAT